MNGPHRRYNPLLREWVLVSPHRGKRPWQGQVESDPTPAVNRYDPTCYLCPGNTRANDKSNPQYDGTLVFDNDFPALLEPNDPGRRKIAQGASSYTLRNLLLEEAETGTCRVVCFSPRHDLSMATLPLDSVRSVVDTWITQYRTLGDRPDIRYVQIFENRGAMMGASSPHPHGQIWASSSVPDGPLRESVNQGDYQAQRQGCMLCAYVQTELREGVRTVVETPSWLVVVPFWAVWPFEVLVLSKRHITGMDELTADERQGLAQAMQAVSIRYDNLFRCPFPYSMGLHQRPTDGHPHPEWHLHAHYFPPLLRSATVRKFMVGYELLCAPQRDITAELAAERLREVSGVHYTVS